MMRSVVLASDNRGKLKELRQLLADSGLELISQSDLGVKEVAETGLSFIENALLKARQACHQTGLPAIADDSGLEVDALDGAPGIYSARYAGVTGAEADAANNSKLLSELKRVVQPHRSARFQCVIVYLRHARDPTPLVCQGTWEGSILFTEAGTHGFGYDPLFHVPTHDCAAAELPTELKNSLSHRGQALEQLVRCWNTRP